MRIPGLDVSGLLGRGGMGVVLRARETATGRELAVKLITDVDPGSEHGQRRLQRFQREGEISARLDHPGIVRVHSAGALADGRPYLAYALVEGARPLDEAWEALGRRERVELVRDAARALGYAHERGVIHRDVKPDNLLVDEQGQVKVADFGLAAAAGLSRLTRSGAMLGTPTHMAPELLTGERDAMGPATDVWALGVCLYQALTDRLPFEGKNLFELAVQIRESRLRPPSSGDGSIPRALERVCLRALERDPRRRYADGSALGQAIDDALANRLSPEGGTPLWAAGLGLVLVAALVCAGTVFLLRGDDRPLTSDPSSPAPTRVPEPGPETLAEPQPSRPSAATQRGACVPSRVLPDWRQLEPPPDLVEPEGSDPLASVTVRSLVREDPTNPVLVLHLARSYEGIQEAARAAYWYRQAAGLGSSAAMAELGVVYRDGAGVPRDRALAVYWLARGVDGGSDKAAREASRGFYEDTGGLFARNLDEAIRLARLAQELERDRPNQGRDSGNLRVLGRALLERGRSGDVAEGLECLRQAIRLGAPGLYYDLSQALLDHPQHVKDSHEPYYWVQYFLRLHVRAQRQGRAGVGPEALDKAYQAVARTKDRIDSQQWQDMMIELGKEHTEEWSIQLDD